jgi:HEAT repeat protein
MWRKCFFLISIVVVLTVVTLDWCRPKETPEEKVPRLLKEFDSLPSGFFDPFYMGRSAKCIDDDWQSLGIESVPALIKALKNDRCPNRYLAAERLSQIPGSKAVEPLVECLQDSDSTVRRWCISALGTTGDEKAVTAIIPLLNDSEASVRTTAAKTLGKLKAKQAVEPLICALEDENWNTRREAIEALCIIGDGRAVDAINQMLTKEHGASLRDEGKDAIKRLQERTKGTK